MELEGLRYLLIEPVARGFLRRTHRRTGQGGQGSDQQAQRGIVNDYEGTKGLECFWGFLSLYTAGRLGEPTRTWPATKWRDVVGAVSSYIILHLS